MLLALATLVLLPNAHAHNDYAHPRPLLDALEQGFLSVEADVYLVDGELRVGHDREDLRPGRTLESLYLDPLAVRVKENEGSVYEEPGVLTLLVDIKADGALVQKELERRLPAYRQMLSFRIGSTLQHRAVQIILSGARTADCAAGDGFLFKDGRPDDLKDDPSRTPLISQSYSTALGTLSSPLPPEARAKLDDLVARTHHSKMRLRLWGSPDMPTTWRELRDARVDLINTDRLAELRKFLLTKE